MIERLFEETMKAGGKLLPEAEKLRRQEICKGCDWFGKVQPIPGYITLGCTECGCPMETKTGFEYHFLTGFKLVKCGHPEGNKWNNK